MARTGNGDVFKGKGKVGVETHGKGEKEGEDVAPIGIGRAWAWELGTSSIFTVVEKSVIESLNKFVFFSNQVQLLGYI